MRFFHCQNDEVDAIDAGEKVNDWHTAKQRKQGFRKRGEIGLSGKRTSRAQQFSEEKDRDLKEKKSRYAASHAEEKESEYRVDTRKTKQDGGNQNGEQCKGHAASECCNHVVDERIN